MHFCSSGLLTADIRYTGISSVNNVVRTNVFVKNFCVYSNIVDFQIVSKLHLNKWLQYNFWQPQNQLYGLVWPCGKLATNPILCFYLWAVVLSRQYGTTSWLHVKYSLKASSIPLIPFIISSLFLYQAHCIEDNEGWHKIVRLFQLVNNCNEEDAMRRFTTIDKLMHQSWLERSAGGPSM